MPNPVLSTCEIGPGVGIAEAECTLSQVVSYMEEIVELAEAPCGATLPFDSMRFVAVNQSASPTVRGAVGERAEELPAARRLEWPINEREKRI